MAWLPQSPRGQKYATEAATPIAPAMAASFSRLEGPGMSAKFISPALLTTIGTVVFFAGWRVIRLFERRHRDVTFVLGLIAIALLMTLAIRLALPD